LNDVLETCRFLYNNAYKSFFAKIKNGKADLPRYKGKDRYDSFTYPSQFRVSNDRVNLSKIGIIRFRPIIKGTVHD